MKEKNLELFGDFTVQTNIRHILAALDNLSPCEFRMWMDACNGDRTPQIHYLHYEGAEQRYIETGNWERG